MVYNEQDVNHNLCTGGGGESYTALYTYTAQYEDELSFEAGDTVMVVNKDEADWWKGECNGKSGVFPSNYVEPMKCKSIS